MEFAGVLVLWEEADWTWRVQGAGTPRDEKPKCGKGWIGGVMVIFHFRECFGH